MKKNTTIITSVLAVSIAIAIITGLVSCADGSNSHTTTLKESDSSDRKDNTIGNTVTNPRGQDKMMSDSTTNNNANNNNANNNNNSATDAAFMMKAAEINMEEIKLGKLAQQKGTMSHVKELGKMMVTEHTQAMAGLTTLAKTEMVKLPTVESQKIMDAYKMLSEKKGKDFDKAYSDMMVEGHKEAIALFEKANSDTKDANVKTMTTSMIPKLKTHLEHAEMCKKECEKM